LRAGTLPTNPGDLNGEKNLSVENEANTTDFADSPNAALLAAVTASWVTELISKF